MAGVQIHYTIVHSEVVHDRDTDFLFSFWLNEATAVFQLECLFQVQVVDTHVVVHMILGSAHTSRVRNI